MMPGSVSTSVAWGFCAACALAMLRAARAIGMHWGTFRLTEEPLDEPPHRLRRALDDAGIAHEQFWVFQHGESRTLWDESGNRHSGR